MVMIGVMVVIMVSNLGISIGVGFLEMKEWCQKEKERKKLEKKLKIKRAQEQRMDDSSANLDQSNKLN